MAVAASRYAAALAGMRIYAGIFWLIHGFGKVTSAQWAAPGGEFVSILRDLIGGTSGPYHDFVTGVVLPNVGVFAALVAWGETLTGVALLLGLLSRIGGAVGFFLAFNYWAAGGGFAHLDSYADFNFAAMALSVIHLIVPTGLTAGIDGLIAERKLGPKPGG